MIVRTHSSRNFPVTYFNCFVLKVLSSPLLKYLDFHWLNFYLPLCLLDAANFIRALETGNTDNQKVSGHKTKANDLKIIVKPSCCWAHGRFKILFYWKWVCWEESSLVEKKTINKTMSHTRLKSSAELKTLCGSITLHDAFQLSAALKATNRTG